MRGIERGGGWGLECFDLEQMRGTEVVPAPLAIVPLFFILPMREAAGSMWMDRVVSKKKCEWIGSSVW